MTQHVLDRLAQTIASRRDAEPDSSYTAKLFSRGPHKIAQKTGEEAVELVIEAVRGDKARAIAESGDLLYHVLVLWSALGITPDEVWAELARREGFSGYAHVAKEAE